jgi:hypothetical protein
MKGRILYLQLGDLVYHKKYSQWGIGEVVEEWSSMLPGGPSYVKVEFQDRRLRVFDNDFKSASCCCYSGLIQIAAGD